MSVAELCPHVAKLYGLRFVKAGASNVNGLEELEVPTSPLMVTAMGEKGTPPPAGAEHLTTVTVFHDVDMHAVDPSRALGDPSYESPKLLPDTETIAKPDAGEFVTAVDVIVGASKVNLDDAVPTIWLTLTVTASPAPVPYGGTQPRAVEEVHASVRHEDPPRLMVGEYPIGDPKLIPLTVIDGSAVVGMFCVDHCVVTGESYVNDTYNVPIIPLTLDMADADPTPKLSAHANEVADVHEDVKQSVAPSVCVDVALFASKFKPETVSVAPAEWAPLYGTDSDSTAAS